MRMSSKRYRKRPKPDAFLELSLDVLFLIAEHLHPNDILNLSRTCRSIRAFLMDESSTLIWKTARRQVEDLPDCPADLTEQEYADLVFDAHCHGCGRLAKTAMWYIRRRYCKRCRSECLIDITSCSEIISENNVLSSEDLTIGRELETWVDVEQVELFWDEYDESSDKDRFLRARGKQYWAIYEHANACQIWWDKQERQRREKLALRRQERHEKIFDRLRQHGYGPEVEHLGQSHIQDSYKSAFGTSKPLTDGEWGRMWPKLRKIMEDARPQRLEEVVYQPRRRMLTAEYKTYMAHPAPDTPVLGPLPHVADVARFLPFRSILKAPESTQVETFSSVFALLPALADEWRKKFDAEIAMSIKIPSCLSPRDATDERVVAPTSATSRESSQTASDRLHLACALFRISGDVFTYPEVFSVSMCNHDFPVDAGIDSERTGSIQDRFSFEFLEETPYIIYACGLDPNVATVEDMDRRNARLRCLPCRRGSHSVVMTWRNAVLHAARTQRYADDEDESDSGEPATPHARWGLVSDEYIHAIQTVEKSIQKSPPGYVRCLLCLPSVGDAHPGYDFARHFVCYHNIAEEEIKQGIHYIPLDIAYDSPLVIMVEGEQVTFSMPQGRRELQWLTRGCER